ncbi:hypothetical protein ACWDKQ_28905 [Saccharopolyspora sp. NPDC000995]
MTADGEDNQVQFDATDQAYLQHRAQQGGLLAPVGAFATTAARAADKAALAQSQAAHGSMRIDPDKVDELARFFNDEAKALEKQARKVQELAYLSPPGDDPVSVRATEKYGLVAAGDDRACYENLMTLAQFFGKTAEKLHNNASDTRTNDQNSAESFGGYLA